MLEVIFIPLVFQPEWQSVADEIVTASRIIMVIGRVDTGKSTFCRYLASAASQSGLKVGVVDADVGQSWIGPPTTIGMKIFTGEPCPTLFPDSFYFTGSISPERYLLETTVGVKRMVENALSLGAERVVIDTTGLVDGRMGRDLKSGKIDLVRPDHVVCFQRRGELETLIKGIETNCCCRVYRLEPSEYVKNKNQNSRRAYRQSKFREYFRDFASQEFQFSQLRGQRTTFLNGRQANDKELENLSKTAESRALYAEWSSGGLFLVTEESVSELAERSLRSHLNIKELYANTPGDFQQILTALIDERGEPICLATIENIDFGRKTLSLKCRKNAEKSAKAIQFSRFHLDADQLPAASEEQAND